MKDVAFLPRGRKAAAAKGFRSEFFVTLNKLTLSTRQWCGHCKRLEPEWKKASELLSRIQYDITLAIVDATDEKNKKLAEEHGVKGFPTIKVYRFAAPRSST